MTMYLHVLTYNVPAQGRARERELGPLFASPQHVRAHYGARQIAQEVASDIDLRDNDVTMMTQVQ